MSLMKLFSRTKKTPPDAHTYTFPNNARSRILFVFKSTSENDYAPNGSFASLMDDVGQKLYGEYGALAQSRYPQDPISENPAIEHFFRGNDHQVIDFILVTFRSWHYRGEQNGVDEINRILREEAIGYEFTDYVRREVQKVDDSYMGRGRMGTFYEIDYPEVIEKREEFTHQEIVKPCLAALANPVFKVANSEMLKAHEHIRKGNFTDAMTCCCASYESVLKTIFDRKKWTHDPKDTCAALVAIAQKNGLIPGFYAELLKAPGIIRNNLSSSHGRGPAQTHTPDADHAHHMIQVASANILLLMKLAKF